MGKFQILTMCEVRTIAQQKLKRCFLKTYLDIRKFHFPPGNDFPVALMTIVQFSAFLKNNPKFLIHEYIGGYGVVRFCRRRNHR
jgi:hypothetical protein